MEKRKNRQTEAGRSMVEMLGVLAIIGILSVTGVAGYNLAVSKRRTNEILDGAAKRAMTVSTQMMLETPINLDEFVEWNKLPGGTFEATALELDNEQFGIIVDDVSKNTCVVLIKSINDTTPLRDVTSKEDTNTSLTIEGCKTRSNDLVLVFDKDLANKKKKDVPLGGSSSSSSGGEEPEEKDPDCSDYPGTSPDYEGGVAGKADDGKTDCHCPEDEDWDESSEKCMDNRPLYIVKVDGYTRNLKYYLDNGVNCPDGYHWANYAEVASDGRCTFNPRNGWEVCQDRERISASGNTYGWLSDCLYVEYDSSKDYRVKHHISCSEADEHENTRGYTLSNNGYVNALTYNDYSRYGYICRRN